MSLARMLWRGYRVLVFPFLHVLSGGGTQASCRHVPSCSVYALQVIERYGWGRGAWLAMRRLLSCHPWSR